MQFRHSLLCLVILLLAGSAYAEVIIEFHFGNSVKPPTSLEISQAGYDDVVITNVRYETRPWLPRTNLANFTQNYYGIRVAYHPLPLQPQTIDLGFELELLHDKAYYVSGDDPDNVVQHFELSDGVNYLLVNAVGRYPLDISEEFPNGRSQFLARAGMGVVVTAPQRPFEASRWATTYMAPTGVTTSPDWASRWRRRRVSSSCRGSP